MSSTAVLDLTALPTPDHITLLFKYDKSTTLLSVLPSTPFAEIRAMLLSALKSRQITMLPGSIIPLPDDPSQLELGMLKDRKDASKGWTAINTHMQQAADTKTGKKRASSKSGTMGDNPAGAGLTDGSWLTYRIAKMQEVEDEDTILDDNDSGWNVILPSYDDEEDLDS